MTQYYLAELDQWFDTINELVEANRALKTLTPEQERENSRRDAIRETSAGRWEDPDYKKQVGESIRQAYANNPDLRASQAEKSSGPNSDTHNENIRRARLAAPPRSKATRKKISDKQIGNQKRARPIHTPLGVFSSRKKAAEAYSETLGSNVYRRLADLMKTKPEEYFYLDKQ